MNKQPTLGSLFDGSGGFPLAGLLCGIDPLWASEVECFPIRVTTKRLPQMKHLGDINKINGEVIPPVDIITGGFCCQDLSVAGKRAGLHGERSGLFFEVIRIIKEMRIATNNEYPKFAVLENVPGMYSSNKGLDFLEVLNELVKIKNETLSVPMPENGKWSTAGEIRGCANALGDGFSVGWRTLDAQFWGVAQRRRRCYIVVDFTGERAGEILFDESRLRGNSPQSGFPWKGTARNIEASTSQPIHVLNDQGGSVMSISENVTDTLRAQEHGHPPITYELGVVSRLGRKGTENLSSTLRADMGDNQTAVVIENHPADSRIKLRENGIVQTLDARMGMGGGNVPLVMNERQYALTVGEDLANTLTGTDFKGTQCVFEPNPQTLKIRSGCDGGGKGILVQDNKSATLSCNNDQTLFVPLPTVYGICADSSNSMKSANPHSGVYEADTSRTLDQNGGNPACNQGGIAVVESYALQGSMIGRDDKNGPNGNGINQDLSFTLNCTDIHAVAFQQQAYDKYAEAPPLTTLMASGGTYGGGSENLVTSSYTVRRLTPQECALLQGLPHDWCENLETSEPTDADIAWWSEVFETHRLIVGTSTKPKSRNQIIKWLRTPHSDSAEYKMWGNGVALPCVCFVLSGIAELINQP